MLTYVHPQASLQFIANKIKLLKIDIFEEENTQ